MKTFFLFLIVITAFATTAKADAILIKNFVVKENPFAQDEVAIVAADTAGVVQEGINGTFSFTINGFQELLKFEHGTAFYHHKLKKSAFLFVKHENDLGSNSILYYVYKSDNKLTPVHISWLVLIIIPIILVLLGYLFKKFLVIALILFCIFFYFNYHNGLSVPNFFETIVDGLKHLAHA